MAKILLMALSILAMGTAGCLKVDASLPKRISVGGNEVYSAPPPADIAPADPNSKADLIRENDQLRQRISYLENDIRKLSHKTQDQDHDIADIRADMQKIASQRDRYKRGGGE